MLFLKGGSFKDLKQLLLGYEQKEASFQNFVFHWTVLTNGYCTVIILIVRRLRRLFLFPASKAKAVKKKKRASKLSAIEMLEKKNERQANFKELEIEQRKKEFEFQKQKSEEEAAERREKLQLELEEKRAFLALLKNRL